MNICVQNKYMICFNLIAVVKEKEKKVIHPGEQEMKRTKTFC